LISGFCFSPRPWWERLGEGGPISGSPDLRAFPLGLKGVIIGQGETYEAALADVKSAIQFHLESFGAEALEIDPPILEAFVAETRIDV
jgi:predicted RNase H-like HicB family nuclease